MTRGRPRSMFSVRYEYDLDYLAEVVSAFVLGLGAGAFVVGLWLADLALHIF